jgi:hypothetical protein
MTRFERINKENKCCVFLLIGLLVLLIAGLGLLLEPMIHDILTESCDDVGVECATADFEIERNNRTVTVTHVGGH